MKGLFRNRDLMVGTYDHLFTYFSDGFLRFASPGRERVLYPGMGSCFGPAVDGLQGFARTAPLLAAWATSSREPVGTDPVGGQRVDLVALLQEGLLTGTNKALPPYWGNIGDHDQNGGSGRYCQSSVADTGADLVNSFEAQARSSGKLASPSQFRRNA